jgi:hypothetical protein
MGQDVLREDDLQQPSSSGLEIAFIGLLKILVEREAIAKVDWDRLSKLLTDLSANYQIDDAKRRSLEEFARTLRRHRPT